MVAVYIVYTEQPHYKAQRNCRIKGGAVKVQDIIKQIVDMDRKAREATEAMNKERVNSEREVAERRVALRAEYLEQARQTIPQNVSAEKQAAQEKWEIVEKKNTTLSQQLDALYSQKCDEWVQTIVAKVIGE